MQLAELIEEIAAAVADAAAASDERLELPSARVSLPLRVRFARRGGLSVATAHSRQNAARLVLTLRRDHA